MLLRILFLFLFPMSLFGQTATVIGLVRDNSGTPVSGAEIKIHNAAFTSVTDSTGRFLLQNIPFGDYTFEFSASSFLSVSVNQKIDLQEFSFPQIVLQSSDEMPGQETENNSETSSPEGEQNISSGQFVPSALNASRDAFTSAASFTFSVARFRTRGYEDGSMTLMNGSPVTDLVTGRTPYYMWSGLNDVMRSRDFSQGLAPAAFSFGEIRGAYSIDSRASVQRKQVQVSYSLSNRSYDNRVMATFGTGITKKGWAGAFSLSHRWAEEGYIPGTFYDGTSYFASVEKIIGEHHSLCLTAFASPAKSGRASPSVQEMYNLAGTNYYNPNWGYQDGKKRNAVVARNYQPVFIFTHAWNINESSSLTNAVSYRTGKSALSSLSGYNAPNPLPNFYRNLPSFITDPTLAAQAAALLSGSEEARQINWAALYEANRLNIATVSNANGIAGNSVTGKQASYIVHDNVNATNYFSFNSVYNNYIGENTKLSGGITWQKQETENYREVNDLLGADFYVDLNQYAEQDYPDNPDALQNDLNHPNRILHKGDKLAYDYVAHIQQAGAWWQTVFKFNHIDFFFGTQISQTGFYREGKMRNGIFPENSFGNSVKQNFVNLAVKDGITWKINGRNYLFCNTSYLTRPPAFVNTYTSARTRDNIAPELTDEKISAIEGGYLLKAPRVKGKAVFYFTQINDATETSSFYHDDFRTFVNYTLTNIDKRYTGTELSLDANIGNGFSAVAVAAIGQYTYSDRPLATITQDNSAEILADREIVYAKNFHVAGSPEKAYTLGINYRGKQFWFVNLSFNYFDGIWIDYNPARRTIEGIDLVDPNSSLFRDIVDQEKADAQFTMDLYCGKSWKVNDGFKSLKKNTFLVLNVGVNNLLNNKKFITNGYEQLRYDFFENNVNKFAPKYFYAMGTTFFINLTLRMN